MAQHTRAPQIALGQMNPAVGDLAQNLDTIIDLARRARVNRAELLALPYGALTGYPLGDLPRNAGFVRATQNAIRALAQRLESEVLAELPVLLAHDGPATNRGDSGQVSEHIFFGHARDATQILSSDQVPRVGCGRLNVGILSLPAFTPLFSSGSHLDLFLVLCAVPFETSGPQLTAASLAEAAQIAGAPLAFVNLVGGQDELVFAGGSAVIDAQGKLLCRAPLFAVH